MPNVPPEPSSTRRRRLDVGAACLGAGFLIAASLPPWGWWPLAFVGIAIWDRLIADQPARARFARTWIMGMAWMSMGMGWMWFLTAPGYVIASMVYTTFAGVAAVAATGGRWRRIGLPAGMIVMEWVRWRFPFGGVPLANLALGQVSGPFATVARVGGAVTLCGLTVVGGQLLSIVFGWWRGCWRESVRPAAIAAAIIIGAVLIASLAPAGTALSLANGASSIRIAIVQGGGPQGTRAVDGGRDEEIAVFNRHLEASRTIAPGSVDLIVWPENTVNADGKFAGSPEEAQLRQLADDLETPISVGMVEDVDRTPSDSVNRFTNAQVIITPSLRSSGSCINDVRPSAGAIGTAGASRSVTPAARPPATGSVPCSRYDKVHRVPFGEYMPMRSILESLGAPTNLVPKDAVSGRSPAITDLTSARLGNVRLGVVISWEVFFADRGRDAISHGGAVMLNPTNGSSYTGTVLQTQQIASSKLRALETGRWVVQAAPTGFSAFVSPDAQVLQRTGISERKIIIRDVPVRSGSTWYVTLGDHPFGIASLILVGVAIALSIRDRRRIVALPAAARTDTGSTDTGIGTDASQVGADASQVDTNASAELT